MKIRIQNLLSLEKISSYLFFLPRTVASYPFIFIASLILLKGNRRDLIIFGTFIFLFVISLLVNSFYYDVSIGHFFLEMIFIFPILFFISTQGKGIRITKNEVRLFSFLAFFLSIVNITVYFGFPFRLPYIHYSQDHFSAFFGGGGPKIMAVIGFICLSYELYVVPAKSKSAFWILVSVGTLIIPNYVTGIAIATFCVAISSFIVFLNNIKRFNLLHFFLLAFFIIVAFNIFFSRIDNFGRGSDFFQEFATIPKIMNYSVLFEAFREEPTSMIFGFGVGQYSSEIGMWSLGLMPTKSPIDFEITEPLRNYFYPLIVDIFVYNRGFMSSISGPQSSVVTIFAEMGIITGTLFMTLFWLTIYKNLKWNFPLMINFLLFYTLFFLADNQHDSIIFAYPFIFSILAFKEAEI